MSVVLVIVALFSCASAQGILHLNESKPCAPIGHITRTCKSLEQCPQAMHGIRVRQFPEICNFRGIRPDICCPNLITATTTTTTSPTDEGDICKEGSPPWYCKIHSECPGLQEAIRKGRFPKICSFKGRNNPIVCCQTSQSATPAPTTSTTTRPSWPSWTRPGQTTKPNWPSWTRPDQQPVTQPEQPPVWGGSGWTTTPTSVNNPPDPNISSHLQDQNRESKSETMCKKYAKYVWKKIPSPVSLPGLADEEELIPFCGRVVQPLIVNGVDAGPREFPHMARIGYGPETKIEWLCGGSLISERYVLSAAHCTRPGPNRVASWVNLGDLDVTTNSDDAQPVTIKIIQTINHPEYTGKQLYHDIALYRMEKDAPLGIFIRPICLNTKIIVPQPKAVASGWGHTLWGGRPSAILQKVDLNLVSNRRCNDSYQSNIGQKRELPNGIVSDYMICAGGTGGKDTCQGDSGGPLQIALESPFCTYAIIGVTSFGKGCGTDTPGVYTNVAYYIKWIEDIVWPT